MREIGERYPIKSIPTLNSAKKLGSYLVEAGLLTADQINVVLNDQQATGMRFGEIVVARGWLKEQTVEWIVSKVVEPDRRARKRQEQMATRWVNEQAARVATSPVGNSSAAKSASSSASKSASNPNSSNRSNVDVQVAATDKAAPKAFVRREAPISKPLPSVSSSDGDVNWVG